jgi:antibiotic biosynthesis monooxygenase (ABM) superfamily enzyme
METTPLTALTEPSEQPEPPVTVVVRRRVRAGREAAYEDWLRRLIESAHAFPGYLGAQVQPPPPAGPREYVSIFRFRTPEELRAFETSDVRRRALAEVTPHVEADAVWERMTGLEIWFEPPPGMVVPQPSPLRMAMLLIAVVYALVLSIGWLVGQALYTWPYPARLLVTITIEVFLMVYIVMPPLTRRLKSWIYPSHRVT